MSLNRRTFLAASAFAVAAPGMAIAAKSDLELFELENYQAAVASGEPFMLAVLSSW